jgi:hypothetical protein
MVAFDTLNAVVTTCFCHPFRWLLQLQYLPGAIATHGFASKVQQHFRNLVVAGDRERSQQIVDAIVSNLTTQPTQIG